MFSRTPSIDSGSQTLSQLLSILNERRPESSLASLADATTIDLICKLLSRDDYIKVAEKLTKASHSDVRNMLEFMLHVLRDCCLSAPDVTNRRARRLMFKILSETPIIPRSFMVTDVDVPDKRDYIAQGGFGNVYKGEFRGTAVALKMLYRPNHYRSFCREALMWGSLKHKFVLPFIGIHEYDGATIFLVSPYMENGTLAQWRKYENPSTAEIRERIFEVAQGMEYIHSEGVVHGDLRGENILLDSNLHVQIADFGLTRLLDATNTHSGTKHVNFAAPELFGLPEHANDPSGTDPSRTQMTDVYAFGCLYYEIHYDSMPFAGKQEMQIMALVTHGRHPSRLDKPPLSDEEWRVIRRCWAIEPSKRPEMRDITNRIMKISISSPTDTLSGTTLHDSPNFMPPQELSDILQSLLAILNHRPVANENTIDLTCELLSHEDYAWIAEHLSCASDVGILVDFMLPLLCDHRLPNLGQNVNIYHRAKRFMINAISKRPVIPQSLIVTGVQVTNSHCHGGGKGSAAIFKGRATVRRTTVALKESPKSGNGAAFCCEALMWKFLKHDFVLPFSGIYVDELASKYYLMSPYMPNGTLSEWRKKANPSVPEIQKRLKEVAYGMKYIHSEGIILGGLRGASILLDANFHVKISDFSSARLLDTTSHTGPGELCANFAAPELFDTSMGEYDHGPTQMSDIYAFGCLYYEIYHDSMPFGDMLEYQIMCRVSRGERPPRLVQPPLSDREWNLIQHCWASEPPRRPRTEDIWGFMMTISASLRLSVNAGRSS